MKTRTPCTRTKTGRLRTVCAMEILVLLAALPAVLHAQYTYTNENGSITITRYTGPGGAVTIPSTIDGLPVTGIGTDAFRYATMTSVTIPDEVTRIGTGAFYGCPSLTNVTIPDGVTKIAAATFSRCDSLTSVTIPASVASIAIVAFGECPSLRAVFFKGNAPHLFLYVFLNSVNATVYYLPGTTGWTSPFGGLPTAPWSLPNPVIVNSGASFGAPTNGFGFTISWATNIPVVVEACTNLVNPFWSPVGTNTLRADSSQFIDPRWTNYPSRFYRLRSP